MTFQLSPLRGLRRLQGAPYQGLPPLANDVGPSGADDLPAMPTGSTVKQHFGNGDGLLLFEALQAEKLQREQ